MDTYNRTPVKEGETHELTCEGIGDKGDGICRKDKFVIIVPGALIDKTYNVRITRVTARVAFGEIVE